jgi:hypothetical protein
MTSDTNGEIEDENIKYYKPFMIECSSKTNCKADCKGWFHSKYMGIRNLRKIPIDWICSV